MFPLRFYAARYFNPHYWAEAGLTMPVTSDIGYLRLFLNDISTALTPTES
jgi:hypothetical protein